MIKEIHSELLIWVIVMSNNKKAIKNLLVIAFNTTAQILKQQVFLYIEYRCFVLI